MKNYILILSISLLALVPKLLNENIITTQNVNESANTWTHLLVIEYAPHIQTKFQKDAIRSQYWGGYINFTGYMDDTIHGNREVWFYYLTDRPGNIGGDMEDDPDIVCISCN